MKSLPIILAALLLCGCTAATHQTVKPGATAPAETGSCSGTIDLPVDLRGHFAAVTDQALLAAALGSPGDGKLCGGEVYAVKAGTEVRVYRLWNSTNPQGRIGRWWVLDRPEGSVAGYRRDFAVCYQWSPLDKLSECTLQAGARVVIGTGQSAECSPYLTYPASPALQVYIDDAPAAVSGCRDYDAVFNWQSAYE